MGRIPYILALSLSVAVSTRSLAQESTLPSRPNIAEVRFGDGSVVRMTLLQENLEVQTKYGKLQIPLSDVRRVEFGLHVTPEMNQQIAQSIKRLGSGVYKERDVASKDLVQVGHFAFPSLQKASRSSDQEVSYRAASLIKQISERVSPELLKLREEDVIHTTEFTITGKLTSQTIKAHSPHFGEVSLKLSELRTMHVRQQGGKVELVVDAAKHGSSLDQWCDSGIIVDASQRMLITADGQVDLWPQGAGQYMAVPKGYNTAGKGGQFMAGALIGKIGENGKAFYLGDRYDGNTNEEGRLYLLIVPSPWNNASTGTYRVRIQTDNNTIGAAKTP
ncbi:MAG: hypothetical protein HY289_11050 [Planctomycetes bacterium]|nr:hypothetical protein [Planctomycetota bacterium]